MMNCDMLQQFDFWMNTIVFSFTSGLWFAILIKSMYTGLKFIALLAGMLSASQLAYLVE